MYWRIEVQRRRFSRKRRTLVHWWHTTSNKRWHLGELDNEIRMLDPIQNSLCDYVRVQRISQSET